MSQKKIKNKTKEVSEQTIAGKKLKELVIN